MRLRVSNYFLINFRRTLKVVVNRKNITIVKAGFFIDIRFFLNSELLLYQFSFFLIIFQFKLE
jgi:hypothetical protein